MSIKRKINRLLARLGYEIRRTESNSSLLGVHGYRDVQLLLGKNHSCIFFDVGANVGQTIRTIRHLFPESVIHSFEPSPKSFEILHHSFDSTPNIYLVNKALASGKGIKKFYECDKHTDLSSLLQAPQLQVSTFDLETISLDEYCLECQINKIDLLKIDVQGLSGAEKS